MIVILKDNKFVHIANRYKNCHDFTRDIIVAASNKEVLSTAMERYIQSIRESITNPMNVPGIGDRDPIVSIFRNMITSGDAILFNSQSQSDIPGGSLIIFDSIQANNTVDIAHSMIKIKRNRWIGANNLNVLGKISIWKFLNWWYSKGKSGVVRYPFMSRRKHFPSRRGGWNRTGTMTSLGGCFQYKMYYIPIYKPV